MQVAEPRPAVRTRSCRRTPQLPVWRTWSPRPTRLDRSITVTDACGSEVTAEIRNTAGGWTLIAECNPSGWDGEFIAEAIVGANKYVDDWCGLPCEENCSGTCEARTEPAAKCWVESSKTYQWGCP